MSAATRQQTESLIFGSGFDSFRWWGACTPMFEYDRDALAPDDWTWEVYYDHHEEDPDHAPQRRALTTHEHVMRALQAIADGKVRYATGNLVQECRKALEAGETAHFEPDDADSVMQVVVMGGIYYTD